MFCLKIRFRSKKISLVKLKDHNFNYHDTFMFSKFIIMSTWPGTKYH